VSASTGDGLGDLLRATTASLSRGFRDVDIQTDPANGRLLAWLNAHGEVLSRNFVEDRVTIHCRIPANILGRIPPGEAVVMPHESPAGRLAREIAGGLEEDA